MTRVWIRDSKYGLKSFSGALAWKYEINTWILILFCHDLFDVKLKGL